MHRVCCSDVKHWRKQAKEAEDTAIWIARAAWAANNCEEAPFRDSEANRTRAEQSKKDKAAAKEKSKAVDASVSSTNDDNHRGHKPEKVLQLSGIRSWWRCMLCRKIASRKCHLISRKCKGDPVAKWSTLVADEDEPVVQPIHQHTVMVSGSVIWLSLIHI